MELTRQDFGEIIIHTGLTFLVLFLELALANDGLTMRLDVAQRGGSAGPRDVLAALGLADLERQGARLRRTAVEVRQ